MPEYYKLKSNSYFGGKGSAGTYQKIINQIPPHDIKIIGFAGHCAITRYMKPAKINFIIDKSEEVVNDWNHRIDMSDCLGTIIPICADFFDWLFKIDELINVGFNLFVYLDPPYPISTWKHETSSYNHHLTDKQHELLLYIIKQLKCNVAISTYPNELYDIYLKNWRKIEFESSTRHGMATEQLYMNYPEPTELHDYSYLGNDFREREQIKKKHKSLIRKISELTTLEKAMLQKNDLFQ